LISPVGIGFENDRMNIELSDGRTLGVPLAWFPRLLILLSQKVADVVVFESASSGYGAFREIFGASGL
jgi:hypothetical protein